MKHYFSTVLNVPLSVFTLVIIKRHDFGRLFRPVKFSVLISLLVVKILSYKG
jgi:hypothetical protein